MTTRVAIVASWLGAGGAERQLYCFLKDADGQQFNFDVILLRPVLFWVEEIEKLGIKVHQLDAGWGSKLTTLRGIFSTLRKIRPAITHSWHFSANLYTAAAGRAAGIPVTIGYLQGQPDHAIRTLNRIEAYLSFRCPHYLVVNSVTAAERVRETGLRRKRIHVVKNGVDLPDVSECRELARKEFEAWGIGRDCPVIGTIGRMDENKNQIMLFDVLKDVLEQFPDAKLLLIGEGVLKEKLEQEARSRGLSESVVIPGLQADCQKLAAGFDVFCLTSHTEGLSNVILEASAVARPVVSTDAGGTREILEDGKTGFIVPCGGAKAMTAKVRQLLSSQELRDTMGKAGREKMTREFSNEVMVNTMQNVYEQTLREAGVEQ